jgi:hypothetical protein
VIADHLLQLRTAGSGYISHLLLWKLQSSSRCILFAHNKPIVSHADPTEAIIRHYAIHADRGGRLTAVRSGADAKPAGAEVSGAEFSACISVPSGCDPLQFVGDVVAVLQQAVFLVRMTSPPVGLSFLIDGVKDTEGMDATGGQDLPLSDLDRFKAGDFPAFFCVCLVC